MAVQKNLSTVEAFDEFIHLPENAERLFEFIGGEIVEVPSNPYSSKISMRIGRFIGNFVDENDLGHVTGEAGLYRVMNERYAPDVGYISKIRQPALARHGANPNPPDLAVEVVSPSDDPRQLAIKISNYLAAGTVAWVMYPDDQQIDIHAPGQQVRTLGIDDVLEGGTVLPGFQVAVKLLFKD